MSEWSRNPPPAPDPLDAAPRPGRTVPLGAAVAAAVVMSLLAGLAGAGIVLLVADDGGAEGDAPAAAEADRRRVVDEASAISDVVERALPAIVTVINDEAPVSGDPEVINVGTGVIVDARGFIVTNDHVVRQSANLRVILHDGTELPASVVSSDAPFTDVAVVRIQPQQVEPVAFGDSASLKLGQRVIAIGSVLGDFRETVTTGVVSGLGRTRRSDDLLIEDLIQTDAAINHGGSGGPLLNLDGELVGLNTTVIRTTREGQIIEGLALSLSSRVVQPIIEAIVERNRYDRPYVGLQHQDIDAALAAETGLGTARGAIVLRVTESSPADDAGLLRGDIILRMGELELNDDLPFLNALAKLSPGETSAFRIIRDGAEQTVEVRVALRP